MTNAVLCARLRLVLVLPAEAGNLLGRLLHWRLVEPSASCFYASWWNKLTSNAGQETYVVL